MDFISVILFLAMYYLRPHEWSSVFANIRFVQLVMLMAIASLLLRERGLRAKDLLKTPHDWMMLAFLGWAVVTSGTPWSTFTAVLPFAMFYLVIVHTLTDMRRINIFAGWWTFLIVIIAVLALAGEYGFDPLGSYSITHGPMKDRLILNLSIFNNPNSLGHNVAPALAMLYFFCVWKRPFLMKNVGIALMVIPAYCIWLTVSKGAFLCAAATVLSSQTFGRPKYIQVVIFVAAVLFGGTILWSLPRMTELKKTRSDEAIMGRVAAFTHGLKTIQNQPLGAGYGNWLQSFHKANRYGKAAHSSYVQIGAELGKIGFFLFLGVLYCCLRTLIFARTSTPDEERIRRMMFMLVVSYMVSSWMVDFGYRTTFFMFAGAIAAFHRHLYGLHRPAEEEAPEPGMLATAPWRARLLLQPAMAATIPSQPVPAKVFTLERSAEPATAIGLQHKIRRAEPAATATSEEPKFWNRIGLLDLLLIGVMYWAALRFWAYAVHHM